MENYYIEFENACKNLGVNIIEGDVAIKKFKPPIGRGAFGKVWKGEYQGNSIAIKKVCLIDEDPTIYNDILIEIKNLMFINQPNIPKFYGFWKKRGRSQFNLIFELIDGKTLRQLYEHLHKKTKLMIIRDLCKILEDLHQKKMIHRDIKPDNVMIKSDGQTYLIDFGTAKIATHTTTYTEIQRGTYLYMAPEGFFFDVDADTDKPVPVSTYSDIWSMGCMMSEIFSGILPWHEKNGPILNDTAIQSRLTNRNNFPLPSNLDPEIVEVIKRAIEYDHLYRPTATELKLMIESILANEN